jgi:hypothetical protein
MLEKDARLRGAKVAKRKSKKGFKVGHGGTLDPLATGVIVLGVGSGTKELQNYLTGAKVSDYFLLSLQQHVRNVHLTHRTRNIEQGLSWAILQIHLTLKET